MSSHKSLVLFIGLAAVLLLIKKQFSEGSIVESFGMIPPQIARVERVVDVPQTGDIYTIPGTYQALLQPKQGGMVDYGAFIRYNMPSIDKRADSLGSLDYSSMGGNPRNTTIIEEPYTRPQSQVKTSEESGVVLGNILGEETQPIIYDRYVFANQKDRLRSEADFIRGDLPIVPISTGWFAPSANPQTALREGAMNIMSGPNNETGKELLAMKAALSRTSTNVGGGINYSVQSSPYTTAAGSDVRVTRFP